MSVPPYSTLLLDQSSWDLCLDAFGNIAVAAPPYAVAQDVSSAIRTFLGECFYDTSLGVQYKGILGKNPPLSFICTQIEAAALSVVGVVSASCTISAISGRAITGKLSFTDANNVTQTLELT